MSQHALPPATERRRLEGFGKEALETGRNRLLVTAAVLTLAFFGIGARLVGLTVMTGAEAEGEARQYTQPPSLVTRADIVDRNGVVLASSLPTASLYADPAEIIDAAGAAAKAASIFPEIDAAQLTKSLSAKGRFVWIKRNLSPDQQMAANRLGVPGFAFLREEERVYPHGTLTAHILGATDIDGNGVAGIERYFDKRLRDSDKPLRLAVDIRVQSILRTELAAAMSEFKALGAAGVVMDARTGEAVALVSLPDFDSNDRSSYTGEASFNRATLGVYEMGSTFKLFTAAMALDSGTVDMKGGYDATSPIRIARFTISDDHAQKRWLTVPEIIAHSSNIGAAKMALDVGGAGQRDFLGKLGLLRAGGLEIPEVGRPLLPSPWRDINTMTIAFGHGIAVTPMQLASAISTLVNGGMLYKPTLLRHELDTPVPGERALSEDTSNKMRQLMRLVVVKGTGKKAASEGYYIGGKTGTAEKQVGGRYKKSALVSSFIGAFPIQNPQYVVFAMLDEPHGNKRTFNFASGGWVAAPVVGRVVSQIGPLLGIEPLMTGGEPLALPAIDDERLKAPADPQAGLMRNASVAASVVRPVPTAQPLPSKPVDAPSPPQIQTETKAPAGEAPDDRIARKTREALEQAFAVR